MRQRFKRWLYERKRRRFCRGNEYDCAGCIYHEYLFDGAVFRGVRCRYPPFKAGVELAGSNDMKVYFYRCKRCENRFIMPREVKSQRGGCDYCPMCGAALVWDNLEEEA